MLEVPENWVLTEINKIARVVSGGTPSTKVAGGFAKPGSGIPWITPADLSGWQSTEISRGARDLTEEGISSCSAQIIPEGSILFSSRAPIGYVAIAANPVSTSQGFKSLVLKSGVDSLYAYYYMRSIKDLANSVGTGTTFKEISGKAMGTLPFVLAPHAEQLEIGRKLNLLLEGQARLKKRLERVRALIKSLIASVLVSAANGSLTEEWRKVNHSFQEEPKDTLQRIASAHTLFGGLRDGNASQPTEDAHDLKRSDIPPSWEIALLKEICEPGRPITYGILMPGPEQEDGVPYIRVADFPGNVIRLEGIRKTTREIDEKYRRSKVRAGDIIISIRGSVGRLIAIPPELDGANITQDTARISVESSLCGEFVRYMLLADQAQSRIKRAVRGAAIKGVNIGDIRATQIPFPPLEEQREIASRVSALLSSLKTLEDKAIAIEADVCDAPDQFFKSAFTGAMTRQWRENNASNGALDPYDDWGVEIELKGSPQVSGTDKRRSGKKSRSDKAERGRSVEEYRCVVDVLSEVGVALDGQALLNACGYSDGSSVDSVERFFLDLRGALSSGRVTKLPRDSEGQDWFKISH